MKSRFFLLASVIFSFLLASCGDANQILEIGEDGRTDFEFIAMIDDANTISDLLGTLPLGMDARQGPNDTIIQFEQLMIKRGEVLTKEELSLLADTYLEVKNVQEMGAPKTEIKFACNYASTEERDAKFVMLDKLAIATRMETGDNTIPTFTELFGTTIGYSLDLDAGRFVLNEAAVPSYITGGIDLNQIAAMMPPEELEAIKEKIQGSMTTTISLPGKIQKVEIPGVEVISDNTVKINRTFFDILISGNFQGGEILFDSPVVITDPKATEQWDPEPTIVAAGKKISDAPSDATLLLERNSADQWVHYDGSANKWNIKKGVMTCNPGTGTIKTKKLYGDCQLHIEWKTPNEPNKTGQDKGNSGIFFQNKYEIQILNSFENRTYSNGQAGAIYKQSPPLVNVTKSSKDWNVYDIIFHAPEFDLDGNMTKKATITALHNGVLIQDHFEIEGTTEYIGRPKVIPHGDGPLVIQDHSNKMQFRNIWIREL